MLEPDAINDIVLYKQDGNTLEIISLNSPADFWKFSGF